MSVYNPHIDIVLDKFLEKAKHKKEHKCRSLSPDETCTFGNFRELYREFNILITETIAVVNVMKKINEEEFTALIFNLFRIMNSLTKQRDKAYVVCMSFSEIKPNTAELSAILSFYKSCQTRLDYIRNKALHYNYELTPIEEYLSLKNCSLLDDMYSFFGSRRAIVEAGKEDACEMDKYTANILTVVKEAGLRDKYRGRLEVYLLRSNDIHSKAVAEKMENDLKKARDIADAGLFYFESKFNKCVRLLEGCEEIGFSRNAFSEMVINNGRSSLVILCCYSYHNRFIYRYISVDNSFVPRLCNARVFGEHERSEAEKIVEELSAKHPDRAYDIRPLSHVA